MLAIPLGNQAQEARITADNIADADTALIASMPGLGRILSAVVAAEIDGIERFGSAAKLCAYAGLVHSKRPALSLDEPRKQFRVAPFALGESL